MVRSKYISSKSLNIIGLILGMVGVAIIFVWGPPQPNLDPESKLRLGEISQEITELRKFHSLMSSVGLGFIFFGFSFQLFAIWSPFKQVTMEGQGSTSQREERNIQNSTQSTRKNITENNDSNHDKTPNHSMNKKHNKNS